MRSEGDQVGIGTQLSRLSSAEASVGIVDVACTTKDAILISTMAQYTGV